MKGEMTTCQKENGMIHRTRNNYISTHLSGNIHQSVSQPGQSGQSRNKIETELTMKHTARQTRSRELTAGGWGRGAAP